MEKTYTALEIEHWVAKNSSTNGEGSRYLYHDEENPAHPVADTFQELLQFCKDEVGYAHPKDGVVHFPNGLDENTFEFGFLGLENDHFGIPAGDELIKLWKEGKVELYSHYWKIEFEIKTEGLTEEDTKGLQLQ